MCNQCNKNYYIKKIQYTAPLLAPLTKAEELRQELLNLTGEVYVMIEPLYCPFCGEKLKKGGD